MSIDTNEIARLIEPSLEAMGYRLVRVMQAGGLHHPTVQVMAEWRDDLRRVLELAYFRGQTQARIAEDLGIPLGTVKTRTLAAMRKLRRALTEEHEES